MSLRLINERDPSLCLHLNRAAWFEILALAEEFSWIPYGTVEDRQVFDLDLVPFGYDPYEPGSNGNGNGSHAPVGASRKVLLEDALNLADALERAFLEYEPQPAIAGAYITVSGRYVPFDNQRPGIGTIATVIDFCRHGPFLIAPFS